MSKLSRKAKDLLIGLTRTRTAFVVMLFGSNDGRLSVDGEESSSKIILEIARFLKKESGKGSIGGGHYFIDVEQYDSDSTILYFTPVESDFKELL